MLELWANTGIQGHGAAGVDGSFWNSCHFGGTHYPVASDSLYHLWSSQHSLLGCMSLHTPVTGVLANVTTSSLVGRILGGSISQFWGCTYAQHGRF